MAMSTLQKVTGVILVLLAFLNFVYLYARQKRLIILATSPTSRPSLVLFANKSNQFPLVAESDLADLPGGSIPSLFNISTADSGPTTNLTSIPTDRPTFVFVKTHKTGGTTASAILNRYGYQHHLSFFLNCNNQPSGNFNSMKIKKENMYPPIGIKRGDWNKYQFEASAVHMIYDRPLLQAFFRAQKTPKYLTILREPVEQFISSFNFFKIAKRLWPSKKNLALNQAIDMFLEKPTYYQKMLNKNWNLLHNSQIYDLGLDDRYHQDENKVKEKIEELERDFDLVLLTEYFDESLLLLKELMRWDWPDIMFISKNLSPPRPAVSDQTKAKLQHFLSADVLLYKTFSARFFQKLDSYGRERIEHDLSFFKTSLDRTFKECVGSQNVHEYEGIKHIEYNGKPRASARCNILLMDNNELIKNIVLRQGGADKSIVPPRRRRVVSKPRVILKHRVMRRSRPVKI